MNAISAPAITPGMISGSVTCTNACHGVAPQSRAASTRLSSMPARRERTTMATKPMQNAMCASATETRPSVKLSSTKKMSSATPIRISGMAIGVSTRTGSTRSR